MEDKSRANKVRLAKTRHDTMAENQTRKDKVRQYKTRQDKTNEDNTNQPKTRHDKTRQGKRRLEKTKQHETRQDKVQQEPKVFRVASLYRYAPGTKTMRKHGLREIKKATVKIRQDQTRQKKTSVEITR